jgi:hypothetical protein
MLTSPVGHVGEREWVTLVLYRLPARSRDVVVVAHYAERISAAFRATVRTDCSTAIRALRHGGLATRHPNVVISEFNLAEWTHEKPKGLFGIVARGIAVEPCGSAKWTMASEIRKGRYIATLNVSSLLHPRRIVSNALPRLRRPAAFEMPCFILP